MQLPRQPPDREWEPRVFFYNPEHINNVNRIAFAAAAGRTVRVVEQERQQQVATRQRFVEKN